MEKRVEHSHPFNQLPPWVGPAILLVDLDAFFASVEQLDHPGWRGKPVIVGGDADKRGVVSTASYEARAFGVRSAMPSSQAIRLCPQAIWTRGHYSRYREISEIIMGYLRDETPYVQQVSIDEAFLDVTPTRSNKEHPVLIAQRIQQRVAQLGITCSVGVGTSKTVAKIASDMEKPSGLTVVYPGEERSFLDPLPVRALSGVGAATERKLRSRCVETLGDLARMDEQALVRLFGKNGRTMHMRACGQDDASVESDDQIKSISNEVSFAIDLCQRADIVGAIDTMAAKVARRLRKKNLMGLCVGLKIRLGDRTIHTAQCHLLNPTDDEFVMQPKLHQLLDEVWCDGMRVRLVGVSMTDFPHDYAVQECLFNDALFMSDDGEKQLDDSCFTASEYEPDVLRDEQRRRGLLRATDLVRDKFGEDSLYLGKELRNKLNTTGSAAKNPEDYKR